MAITGPELPPHLLAKRKRQQEAAEPLPEPRSPSPSSTSTTPDDSKRRRTIGPSAPPAPLSERPSDPPDPQDSDSSSSADDFGPSLPPSNHSPPFPSHSHHHQPEPLALPQEPKPQREEWMLVPPSQSDWTARIDPTKLRNRKFNTGKGAKAPPPPSSTKRRGGGGDDTALWTETPEQKRQRLQDEVMGAKKPAQLVDYAGDGREGRVDEEEGRETERRIREFNDKNRGNSSLYDVHQKSVRKEKDDDPSARAFDKEKDMAGGVKIGHQKRKEYMAKAADFGSKFAGGKYL
ncbi:MAG: hypothetical protein Q9220_006784 [cf. Caloplaca sp. 1 TL-2023]